jgi:scyllo-inositol 2-dehydrogenase (NADP+)
MRIVIVGFGNQGKKRAKIIGHSNISAVVDLDDHFGWVVDPPWYENIKKVPIDNYDAAFVCTPDEPKREIVKYLLEHGKHVLVEKPFSPTDEIIELARKNNLVCYTAYNHRFEPHIQRMKDIIDLGELGNLYLCRMFYGFGTAADVKGTWRDSGSGVLSEVGTHLLDLALFWFGDIIFTEHFNISMVRSEISSFDYASINFPSIPQLSMESSWTSWKNTFTVDLYGEKGSAHIDGLRKWGPSTFIFRERVLPSGRPNEESTTYIEPDNTWELEYQHFKRLCEEPELHHNLLEKDVKIAEVLNQIQRGIRGRD